MENQPINQISPLFINIFYNWCSFYHLQNIQLFTFRNLFIYFFFFIVVFVLRLFYLCLKTFCIWSDQSSWTNHLSNSNKIRIFKEMMFWFRKILSTNIFWNFVSVTNKVNLPNAKHKTVQCSKRVQLLYSNWHLIVQSQ